MKQNNHALEQRLNASKEEINQLQENLEAVRTESLTDPLTSLANRKYFDDSARAGDRAKRAERSEPLSLVMTDIDHFKTFNDTWGHLTGDQVLRLVAMSVKQNVKGQDIAARYGGEEFAVILPNTVLRSALTVADHIRRAVMIKELMKRSTGQNLGRVTISLGVATARKGDTAQSLIERADACLYAAKRNGRNRVICETDPEFAAAASPRSPDALSLHVPLSFRLSALPPRRAAPRCKRTARPFAQARPARRRAAPACANTNSACACRPGSCS